MKKKLLIFLLLVLLVAENTVFSFFPTVANQADQNSVALPVREYNTVQESAVIYDEDISNFTAAFDYNVKENNSASLLFDFDTDLKKTLYSEDFEGYEGAFNTTALAGHGTVLSVPWWTEYTLFTNSATDFDLTMFAAMDNRDWGQMKITLNNNLYLDLKGYKHEVPLRLRLMNGDNELAGINLDDLPENRRPVGNTGAYLAVSMRNDTVTVSLGSDAQFSEDEIVFSVQPESSVLEEDIRIAVWQGNNDVWFDDIVLKDPNRSGYETVTTKTENFADPIYAENFDLLTEDDIPQKTALESTSDGGKCLYLNQSWSTTTLFNVSVKDFRADFLIKSINPDWDMIDITLRDDLLLCFRGSHQDDAENQKYTVYLKKDGKKLSSTNKIGNCIQGCYVRVLLENGTVSVSLSETDEIIGIDLTATLQNYSSSGAVTLFKSEVPCYIDDISVVDPSTRSFTETSVSTGEYNLAEIKNDTLSVYRVNGEKTGNAIASAKLSAESGKTVQIALVRYMDTLTVYCNENAVLNASLPYDNKNFKGNLVFENTDDTVKNIKVYDSGRITFKNGSPVLSEIELSDITALIKSDAGSSLKQDENYLTANSVDVNGSVLSSGWFKEDVGDFVLDMNIESSRIDWIIDQFFFATSELGTCKSNVGEDYRWSPHELYRNGYSLTFGVNEQNANIYTASAVENGSIAGLPSALSNAPQFWCYETMHLRIVRKSDLIRVYLNQVGLDPVLVEEYHSDSFVSGNFYWYHRQGGTSAMDITVYDTENRTEVVKDLSVEDGTTRLIFAQKDNSPEKPIAVNEPGVSEFHGEWMRFRNLRIEEKDCDFAMNTESFIGNDKIRNFNISFIYMTDLAYWMTNEFYLASSDAHGAKNCYKLRIIGDGVRGDKDYNIELVIRVGGVDKTVGKADIPHLSGRGSFRIQAIANNGKINVFIRPVNAPENEAVVLSGDAGTTDISGGIYMYAFGRCDISIKNMAVYNGADITNAPKVDFTPARKVYVDTDFSDGKSPIPTFEDEESGANVSVEQENKRMRFNTNDNHYLQTDGFTGNNDLGDFTMDFEMKNLRPAWNLFWLTFHNMPNGNFLGERHLGALSLAILGTEVAKDINHTDNVAKVEGANVQLFKRVNSESHLLGYASVPDINSGREYRFKVVSDGGNISVFAWPAKENMPDTPLIKAFDSTPITTYGDIFVHEWCTDFAFNKLKICNYADYTPIKADDAYNKEIGEIFRVDRVYETVEKAKSKKASILANDNKNSVTVIVISLFAVILAAGGIITFVFLKRKKSRSKNV